MYSKQAFSLVELIVGVSISMILMVSVGTLVSGGMQNILKQKNIIEKNSLLGNTASEFYHTFENISHTGGYIFSSNSGAIFKLENQGSKGSFGYIGTSNIQHLYCSSGSEFTNGNYLIGKQFVAHEEIDEDIFSDFSQIYTQIVSTGGTTYSVDTLNHQVLENGVRIVGGDIFGHELVNNQSGLLTSLNSPTGIALAKEGFFLSDTLNHRILYYQDGKVSLILDKNDGIYEPTGLAYDSIKNILYISNSGKGEILSLSAEIKNNNPDLNIVFSPLNDVNSISNIRLEFPKFTDNLDPLNLSNFNFNNINSGVGYTHTHGNTIEYYFSDYSNATSLLTNGYINNCSPWDNYSLNGTSPQRDFISCSSSNTGSHIRYNGDIFNNFDSKDQYGINISGISPTFTQQGVHLVNIDFYSGLSLRYSDTYKYFVQGDNIVDNLENVELNTIISGLEYPSGLELSSSNILKVNDFIAREEYSYDLSTNGRISRKNLSGFSQNNLNKIPYDKHRDFILENPLSNIDIYYDVSNKYLGISAKYYQYLNCYNPDEKVEKTFILQKNMN